MPSMSGTAVLGMGFYVGSTVLSGPASGKPRVMYPPVAVARR
jgi:hypothetical protein